jgi:hypothetical protein
MRIVEVTLRNRIWNTPIAEQREQSNDGQFRISGKATNVEVTEVMEPGRKRGDEYRCDRVTIEETAHDFDPNLGKTIAKELSERIKKKGRKEICDEAAAFGLLEYQHGRAPRK